MNRVDSQVIAERLFEHGGPGLELLLVFRRPPTLQITLRIVLAAFIIESMRQLMADVGPGRAVINRVVRVRIEERRLQDTRRKDHLVLIRVVVSVYGRRGYIIPFAAINRLAE